ncbi:hypothetical protein BDU57DRAFT_250021 [Ampelomyces quisqualis]|uniref:Uncharacterized protein n=1 Tax=Ampelomyces quisqualis TaxID=50730 RepID=A0A6A5QMQ3_AMPQU|nr:hypothetical protein BDU57DRAFT_250021 [Ampelomyces quisqualis]
MLRRTRTSHIFHAMSIARPLVSCWRQCVWLLPSGQTDHIRPMHTISRAYIIHVRPALQVLASLITRMEQRGAVCVTSRVCQHLTGVEDRLHAAWRLTWRGRPCNARFPA